MRAARVLIIYLEPTPYILGLVERLAARWPVDINVIFAGTNLSQKWDLLTERAGTAVLPASLWQACGLLCRRIRSTEYGVVHLAGWSGHPALPFALLLAAWRGVPVTVESDTPLPYVLSWWKRAAKRLVYPLLFKLPAHFLPGGSRQAAYLQHYGVKPERITIARMTVDVTAIARQVAAISTEARQLIREQFGAGPATCVFLYVGRLEPHKGLQELLTAFATLKVQGAGAVLLLVGEGSMYDVLSAAAKADQRIWCTGRLSGAGLLEVFAAADVLVLPSRFEPWGLVVNEAMAAGLPVIASERVGCVGDLVIEDETGLVVQAESAKALAAAMQRLYVDAILRKRLGARASILIAGWTLEHEADIITSCWKEIVES